MRKISSHYYLRPDGEFGKRPIIQLDDEGRIISVFEAGDNFKEETSLEYYPGIIIPGFIASIRDENSGDVRKVKARAKANGVLRLKENTNVLSSDDYICAWHSLLKYDKTGNVLFSLKNYLSEHTVKAAQILGEREWGVICEGARPGILVLQNIDLRSFTLRPNSSFRLIQK